ncbi:hypothetical protein FGO68_gene14839 [Halteria grandinella]|uniref:Uncharacterized protein n=1 Tax=Halteria grandinella TaxID=5974 RepID=A0A8J8NGX6_HALGN|nr:hypothetical protein FGO68_gene14839 [Halteria grandinella]
MQTMQIGDGSAAAASLHRDYALWSIALTNSEIINVIRQQAIISMTLQNRKYKRIASFIIEILQAPQARQPLLLNRFLQVQSSHSHNYRYQL